MEFKNKQDTIYTSDDSSIDINEIMGKFRYHWKWFLLSFVTALVLAFLYLLYTPKHYEVSTTILIDDIESGGISNELSAFEDLGLLGGSKTSIINEIGMLKSRTLIENVVKDLELHVSYYNKDVIGVPELYRNEDPFNINFFINDSIFYNLDTTFLITRNSKTQFFLETSEGIVFEEIVFGKNIKTDVGVINITPKKTKNIEIGNSIIVKIEPLNRIVEKFKAKLIIEPESFNSSLLILSLTDRKKQKSQDFLDSLVVQYNMGAIEFKSLITNNTDKFINERINDISDALTNIDIGVEEYKTENKLTDIDMEAGLVLESKAELENVIVDLSSQVNLIDYVIRHMEDNKEDLIPSNLGIRDQQANETSSIYNKLLLERNRILKGSSKLNPTVINLDAQLETLRQSIEQSLINLRSSLMFSLNEANNQSYQLGAKTNLAPKQEREFQDIKRKQQIIETLYLYLLQKREENAISLGIPVPNARLIDKANGSDVPIFPIPILIYATALFAGLFIPAMVISILSFLDNKVHDVDDLEKIIKAPILGDIPKTDSKQKIVKENDNSSLAEAFRLLRTNLNFMFSNVNDVAKTIFITSTIGGEGKTFVTINLAAVLASSGKKVLVIGADLRKPKIQEYLNDNKNRMGLSQYMSDVNVSISDIIFFNKDINADIISSGDMPPNPANLLMNGRFEEIIAYGKENYDYVIVDTSPISLVTDTLIIGHQADLFIYLVRANYLDKRLLKTATKLYQDKRLPNFALLLNDTDYKKNVYGYAYGYAS